VSLPNENSEGKARPLSAVVYADKCCGFVLNRGRDGFEAFDIDEHSRGLFDTESAAVGAFFDRKSGGAP